MKSAPHRAHRTDAEWQRWGENDPYFGVITNERFRRHNLTPEVLAEFFESGRTHTAHVLRVCHRQLHPKFSPQRVLDFGCGVGRVLLGLAEKVPEAVGVDVSPAMLDEARRNCEERGVGNVTLALSDDELSAVEGSFDLIHSVLVFQHIDPSRGHALVA
ncbi:MAG: class I SAM-dependent methyltransferase, partial [Planctomycetota bacterium]